MKKLKIFTWHVHGNYLYYLSQISHELYVPFAPGRPVDYVGTPEGFDWPGTIHEVPVDEVKSLPLDCILFQSRTHFLREQYEILTPEQRRLPGIYLEHDPPQEHPTNTRHWVDDPGILLVHVTPFNDLMWDSGSTPTRVIDHGVLVPEGVRYTGRLPRGLAAVNNIKKRGRRLGADVFERVRSRVPVDLIGIGSEEAGGLGEIKHGILAEFQKEYRFFFNPIRYTSLGLAVCEAMMLGMPVVGLATTEMSTVVDNRVSGIIDTDIPALIDGMRELIRDPALAREMGRRARAYAEERFNIRRFVNDWENAFNFVAGGAVRGRTENVALNLREG